MSPLWESDATVREKLSTEESMTPLGIVMCSGATSMRKRRVEIREPGGVLRETGAERSGKPWKSWVEVLSERKEETQSSM